MYFYPWMSSQSQERSRVRGQGCCASSLGRLGTSVDYLTPQHTIDSSGIVTNPWKPSPDYSRLQTSIVQSRRSQSWIKILVTAEKHESMRRSRSPVLLVAESKPTTRPADQSMQSTFVLFWFSFLFGVHVFVVSSSLDAYALTPRQQFLPLYVLLGSRQGATPQLHPKFSAHVVGFGGQFYAFPRPAFLLAGARWLSEEDVSVIIVGAKTNRRDSIIGRAPFLSS